LIREEIEGGQANKRRARADPRSSWYARPPKGSRKLESEFDQWHAIDGCTHRPRPSVRARKMSNTKHHISHRIYAVQRALRQGIPHLAERKKKKCKHGYTSSYPDSFGV